MITTIKWIVNSLNQRLVFSFGLIVLGDKPEELWSLALGVEQTEWLRIRYKQKNREEVRKL